MRTDPESLANTAFGRFVIPLFDKMLPQWGDLEPVLVLDVPSKTD